MKFSKTFISKQRTKYHLNFVNFATATFVLYWNVGIDILINWRIKDTFVMTLNILKMSNVICQMSDVKCYLNWMDDLMIWIEFPSGLNNKLLSIYLDLHQLVFVIFPKCRIKYYICPSSGLRITFGYFPQKDEKSDALILPVN